MATRLDTRQNRQRTVLDQISNSTDLKLDTILNLMNDEITPILRLKSSNPIDRVINIGSEVIQTIDGSDGHGRKRIVSPLEGIIPSFSSGTVTFPAANGGNIVPSAGSSVVMDCPSNEYNKYIIGLNKDGDIKIYQGTPNASEASVVLPTTEVNIFAIGLISVFNNAGTVDNIPDSSIYYFMSDNQAIGHFDAVNEVHGVPAGDAVASESFATNEAIKYAIVFG